MIVSKSSPLDGNCSQCNEPSWLTVYLESRQTFRLCRRCVRSLRDHLQAFEERG